MKGKKFNRRKVLKSVGIASGTVFGLGNASAVPTDEDINAGRHSIERRYFDQRAREAAVQAYADDLLEELTDRGILSSSSVSDLPLGNFTEKETLIKSTETERKVGVTSVQKEGTRTVLLMISENTSTHTLGIYVQPEVGKSYAHVKEKHTDEPTFSISTSRPTTKLEPTDHCSDETVCDEGNICNGECHDSCTDYMYYWIEYYNCYSCGTEFHDCCCELEGRDCNDSDCYCSGTCCPGC